MTTQLTHTEAHSLIHLAADGALTIDQQKVLKEHVESCLECRRYAQSIGNVEAFLHQLLQRQWNRQPIPLAIGLLISKSSHKAADEMLFVTRIAALSVVFMLFVFSAWQFTISKSSISAPAQANVPLIPVPSTSTHLTATNTLGQPCEQTTYVVQENDTLASIALRFAVSKAELMQANRMNTEVLNTGMWLTIPSCKPTPTTDTLTRTFTPVLNTITSTPGG